MTPVNPILSIRNLKVNFNLPHETVRAVRGVSFDMQSGKTLGLVGESGCGKSVTAFSILKLVSAPGEITQGEIFFKGTDILKAGDNEIRKIRGKEIAMIFQEPMTSLNPVFSAGYQISESLILHLGMTKKEARERSVELLKSVGIPNPGKRYDSYPHEFSGGMRQRIMIAMALAASPTILIADEPTTALDVTIQSQILDLLLKIQEDMGMSLLIITHNLGVVSGIADDIAIMYAGEIIESGPTGEIFKNPAHPYTIGLFNAVPKIGDFKETLQTIPGTVPSITYDIVGCPFHPRCPIGIEECTKAEIEYKGNSIHKAKCIKAQIM
jgi:oligopeptide/dipeptide ABC transporter ATP-binding protein